MSNNQSKLKPIQELYNNMSKIYVINGLPNEVKVNARHFIITSVNKYKQIRDDATNMEESLLIDEYIQKFYTLIRRGFVEDILYHCEGIISKLQNIVDTNDNINISNLNMIEELSEKTINLISHIKDEFNAETTEDEKNNLDQNIISLTTMINKNVH